MLTLYLYLITLEGDLGMMLDIKKFCAPRIRRRVPLLSNSSLRIAKRTLGKNASYCLFDVQSPKGNKGFPVLSYSSPSDIRRVQLLLATY